MGVALKPLSYGLGRAGSSWLVGVEGGGFVVPSELSWLPLTCGPDSVAMWRCLGFVGRQL